MLKKKNSNRSFGLLKRCKGILRGHHRTNLSKNLGVRGFIKTKMFERHAFISQQILKKLP